MGVNSNIGKPFLTYDQQIVKLVKDKGLVINDLDYAKKLLKEYGYFSLISDYKQPFNNLQGLNTFLILYYILIATTFLALYQNLHKFRFLLFCYIHI